MTPNEANETEGDPLDDPDSGEEQFSLKVNGKNIKMSRSEVIKNAQLYSATSMKLDQAKKEIEQARADQQHAKTQQEAVKSLLGVLQKGDFDTIAEFVKTHLGNGEAFDQGIIKYTLRQYEESKMSAEQREAIANKKMLQKMRANEEARKKSDQDRAQQLAVNQWSEHINTEIPLAIAAVGLPDSDFVREHIISTWRAAIERGQSPTAKAVAAYVKTRLDAAKMTMTPAAPAEPARRPKATPGSIGNRRPAETGYSSWDDWKANRRK